jgi:hypothetical protein
MGKVWTFGKDFSRRLNSILFHFVWKGEQDRVRREVMCNDTSSGGMKAVDIQLKLTAFRIKHIVDLLYREDTPRWK